MKNRWKYGLVLFAGLLFGQTLMAQFEFSGVVRPRAEYRHGFKTLADENTDPAFYIDQRTRLTASFKTSSYKVFISMQDIRVWGSVSQLNRADGYQSIHQAWGEAYFNPKWSLRVGRQEIVYDDARMFGNVDWAQQARSHDAAVLKYKKENFKFDLGAAFNQNGEALTGTIYTVPNNYKSLLWFWGHYDFSKKFGASLLAMNQGLQPEILDDTGAGIGYRNEFNQTFGTRLSYKGDRLKVNGQFYYEMGEDGQSAIEGGEVGLNALNFGVDATIALNDNWSAILGYEYFSGNDQVEAQTDPEYSGTNRAFNPWFGTNHKFNGLMDYFYVGNHYRNVGLMDPFAGVKWKKNKTWVSLRGHFFQSSAGVLDFDHWIQTGEAQAMSGGLGTELDLTLGIELVEAVTLNAGYSQLFATETMQAIKGGDYQTTQNWAWLMITFKPTFYKTPEAPKAN